LEAVIAATGDEPVAIWANFTYVFPTIRYAVQHPERVERLVLFASMAQRSAVFPDEVIRSFIELVKTNWPLAAQTFGDTSTRQADPVAGLRWGELNRESAPADAVERILQVAIDREDDIRNELASVIAPTLVMHRTGDLNIPLKIGQQVAAAIPNAVFVPVPGVMMGPALGDQEPVFRAALPFLAAGPGTARAVAPQAEPSAFRTVLFTDLVGHTEMMSRLGDERGRDVLREHERITREVLKAHDGTEIKTMGDGFMASFGSVTRAVECAIALQRAFDAWNNRASGVGREPVLSESEATLDPGEALHVRVGLNAGEPIAEDGDLFGATVILASRIAAQAGAGEILIPEPVRHLLAGKAFSFADRGEFIPKGFDDAVRLFEVKWRA
jgi:class 3 adenylate cyclase